MGCEGATISQVVLSCGAAPDEEYEKEEEYSLLTVTQSAVTEIRNLIDQPEAPEGGGVRIATEPDAEGLTLSVAVTPAEDDTVVDTDGARVFLEARAAELLEDMSLIATTDPAGQVQFAVADQSS